MTILLMRMCKVKLFNYSMFDFPYSCAKDTFAKEALSIVHKYRLPSIPLLRYEASFAKEATINSAHSLSMCIKILRNHVEEGMNPSKRE